MRIGLLGPLRIAAADGGYLLDAPPDAVDAIRFTHLVAASRDAEPAAARKLLREALALWRGPIAPEAAGHRPGPSPDRRLGGAAPRRDAGRGSRPTGPSVTPQRRFQRLIPWYGQTPLHEPLRGALMRLLAAAGRPADALTVYEEGRVVLADELGTDPSPHLRRLQVGLLRGTVAEPACPRR
jgi:hypothetical protein